MGERTTAAVNQANAQELCSALAGVLAADLDGFARLRGTRLAGASWTGTRRLPGTEQCTIEGEAWPRASYVCDSRSYRPERRERALADFEALASQIDRCLERPIWFPRDWQRGELFQFAMGERLLTWTDRTTQPPAAVVLKVQEDLRSHGYRVRLNLGTVR